ncbi:MAG: S41 family peptidase [Spirochaetota bacterium]
MKKLFKERTVHFIVVAFLIGMFAGVNISFSATAAEPPHRYLDYFHKVYQIIKTDYVDVPGTKDLFYGAIRGMIASLDDPFSRFLDEKAFNELKEETTGEFVGVGIEISVKDGQIVVISPIDGTPAMKAGIQAGDTIIKVNGTEIKDKDLSDIIKLIRGKPATDVTLSIKREGYDELLDIEMERAPIKIETVKYDVIQDTDTGYLKVSLFSENTPNDIREALKDFNKKNINKLIIDLRWNPGGLLDGAITISDMFLDKGMEIVSTRGRKGTGSIRKYDSENDPLFSGKIIVITNRGSASASEIFSGAMQDNNRSKLLGEKTFGKGSVQKFFNLNENVGVSLTIAKYYTPSGMSIHGKGIKPDYKVDSDVISSEEQKQINILMKKKLLDKFSDSHNTYNETTRKEFYQFVKKHGIKLSDKTADYVLKNELSGVSKHPVYDLEFDRQLREAVKIIDES